ncbi:MAG TPA: AI-2E family transporter [Candidatus Binatia bacterium]|nr:AI-2E family transporter [Candidatus Binatia bacterium]
MSESPRKPEPEGKPHTDGHQVALLRTPQAARWTLLVLTVVALILLAVIVRPFAGALFVAAVMAGAVYPWYSRLTARMGGRRNLAAAFSTVGMILVVVLPLALISVTVAREARDGAAYVRKTLRSEGVEGLVRDLPLPLQALARRALSELPAGEGQMTDLAQEQGGRAAAAVGGVLGATWRVIFQLVMMLIAFYFFLVDGRDLVDWLADVVPLRRGQTARLLVDFRRVSVAVITSSVATAGIQALTAFAGYLIARVPNPIFFGIVTFLVGLIPAVGAASVVLVAAALLYFSGHAGWALFLAIWGVGPVGLIDNVVKPYLIRGGIELHGAVIFFSLIGGIAYFGAVGLLAGPLIVSFFLAVVGMWDRDEQARA